MANIPVSVEHVRIPVSVDVEYLKMPVAIDTDAVAKALETRAYEDVVDKLYRDIYSSAFSIYNRPRDLDFEFIIKKLWAQWINEHEDEIIDGIVRRVSNNMMRSKAYKDRILDKVVENEAV